MESDRRRLKVSGPLSQGDLDQIHDKAVMILQDIGLQVDSEDARRKLAEESGVVIRGDRVCFLPGFVQNKVDELRKRRSEGSPVEDMIWGTTDMRADRYNLVSAVGGIMPIEDYRTYELRDQSRETLYPAVRLADSLYDEGVRWRCSCYLRDVPEPLWGISAQKLDMHFSREACPAHSGFQAPGDIFLRGIEMWEVMGKPFPHLIWPIEPLHLGGEGFDFALRVIDHPNVRFHVNAYTLAGTSAPIQLAGAFAQSTATALGSYLVMSLLAGERAIGFRVIPFPSIPTDMTESRSRMLPVNIWWEMADMQMNRYYGDTEYIGRLDIAVALTGCRAFSGIGRPPGRYSMGKLLADLDTARRFIKVTRGFRFDLEDTLSGDIRAAIEEGYSFLELESTVLGWRDYYWLSGGFEEAYTNREPWLADYIDEKIASNDYRLHEDRSKELDRLYMSAIEASGLSYTPTDFNGCLL